MTPPPVLIPTRPPRRGRRRRRRLASTAAALLALIAAAAIAYALHGLGSGQAGPPSAVVAPPNSHPLQLANGPVSDLPGPAPLAVKLSNPNDPVHIVFHHPPRSGLLFDLDTGTVLWRHAPERVLPIASLTKMMTALLVVAHEPAGARVYVTKQVLDYAGSGMGVLKLHRSYRLETILYGLLLPSGNDAAIALALKVAGSQRAFVDMMNQQAAAMDLRCTHYATPSGIVDAGNHSCAVDLAAEARAVLDSPRLAKIVGTRRAILPFPIKGGRIFLYNNNPLLVERYPGTIGIKTGYTDAAGMCLVAAAERDGRRLGVVLLHSPNWYDQARKLLDRGFALRRE